MKTALIPCFEPDEKLPELVRELDSKGYAVVVVDDGSGESYHEIFAQTAETATVIGYSVNCGKGYALKQGFSLLLKRGGSMEDPVVVMDCDGQHTVQDADRLCEAVGTTPRTLVLGSRKQSAASPLRSRLGNAITRQVFRLATGKTIYDTQTGLRAFPYSFLERLLEIPGNRYEYEMNVLTTFAKEGVSMLEIPVQTIYIDNNRNSHFNPFTDSWRIYREILRFSMSSLTGFCVDYLVYCLIVAAGGNGVVALANVTARVISAAVNYTLNRRFVFRSSKKIMQSAGQYAMLAAGILTANTILLMILTRNFRLNPFSAKVLVELMLFGISWFVQHTFIFGG